MKQTNKNNNLHIIEGLIAIVLLVGIVWFLTKGNEASAPTQNDYASNQNYQQPTDTTAPATSTPATNQPTGKDIVVVSDQSVGTKSVTVDNAVLSKAGFIVITYAKDGKQVLGSSKLLTAGTKQDLEITLTKALDKANTYVAQIYVDDGDKVFNISKDKSLAAITSPAIGYSPFEAR